MSTASDLVATLNLPSTIESNSVTSSFDLGGLNSHMLEHDRIVAEKLKACIKKAKRKLISLSVLIDAWVLNLG
jgi:hypothetical protein